MRLQGSSHPIIISIIIHGIIIILFIIFIKETTGNHFKQGMKVVLSKSSFQATQSQNPPGSLDIDNLSLPFPTSNSDSGAFSTWTPDKTNHSSKNSFQNSDLPTSPLEMDFNTNDFTTNESTTEKPLVEAGYSWEGNAEAMVQNKPSLNLQNLEINPISTSMSIAFTVSGSGGYPLSVQGIDSGNSDFDAAILKYLSNFVFHPSISGENYTLYLNFQISFKRP